MNGRSSSGVAVTGVYSNTIREGKIRYVVDTVNNNNLSGIVNLLQFEVFLS